MPLFIQRFKINFHNKKKKFPQKLTLSNCFVLFLNACFTSHSHTSQVYLRSDMSWGVAPIALWLAYSLRKKLQEKYNQGPRFVHHCRSYFLEVYVKGPYTPKTNTHNSFYTHPKHLHNYRHKYKHLPTHTQTVADGKTDLRGTVPIRVRFGLSLTISIVLGIVACWPQLG